jgi:hypothetical protein
LHCKLTCSSSWTNDVHECFSQEYFFQIQSMVPIALLKWSPTNLSHAQKNSYFLSKYEIISMLSISMFQTLKLNAMIMTKLMPKTHTLKTPKFVNEQNYNMQL